MKPNMLEFVYKYGLLLTMVPVLMVVVIKKCGKKKATLSPLESLPNDLLEQVCKRVALQSLSDFNNLSKVSRTLRECCGLNRVVQILTLEGVPWSQWNPEIAFKLFDFMARCFIRENPEALYRVGIMAAYLNESDFEAQLGGVAALHRASNMGHNKAKYAYAMIMLGEEDTKQTGLELLSSFVKPLLSTTMQEVNIIRYNIKSDIRTFWCNGRDRMEALKSTYVRSSCSCDGGTRRLLDTRGFVEENDHFTSAASYCNICYWDYEFSRFIMY